MREIKFRAWYKGESYPMDPDNLEEWEKPRMFYGVEKLYDGGVEGLGGVSSFGALLEDEQYVLEQYTGLRDRNGREIYEGDIIDGMVVTYCGDQRACLGMNAGWYLQQGDFDRWAPLESRCNENGDNWIVLGNIHEHPHLLERAHV